MVMVAVTAGSCEILIVRRILILLLCSRLTIDIALIPVITIFQINTNFAILSPVQLLIVQPSMFTSPVWALSHCPLYLTVEKFKPFGCKVALRSYTLFISNPFFRV